MLCKSFVSPADKAMYPEATVSSNDYNRDDRSKEFGFINFDICLKFSRYLHIPGGLPRYSDVDNLLCHVGAE